MRPRAHSAVALMLIIASAIAGLAGLPFWVSVVFGGCLALTAIREQSKLRDLFAWIKAPGVLLAAHAASSFNAAGTALAAWVVGYILRFIILAVA
jgi:hypothetical protein